MATFNVEGFSVSHAVVLDGTDGSEEADGDLYAVRSGSLEVDMDTFDNTGDDAVLSQWIWFNYANVNIEMGFLPFKFVSLVTGATITSSGSDPVDGGPTHIELPLWEIRSLNQPRRPILVRVPSKDSTGNVRLLDIVLYSCQFKPMAFDGPSYKDGLLVNYSATALVSEADEAGTALTGDDRAIGRAISKPAA